MSTFLGVVLIVSVVSLGLFFAVGPPFGAINDWTIGLAGVLSAVLVLSLAASTSTLPKPQTAVTLLGTAGAVLVVAGSALVISRTTGYVLAALVESLGFALLGVWLIVVNYRAAPALPRGLRIIGMTAGVLMLVGLAVAPAIVAGIDDLATAPGYVWVAFVGWLGIFFLYPAWCVWFGRGRHPAT